jgi:type IV secretory pathway VirB6-like protein
MNFLRIKQVSGIIFVLKIIFYNYFSISIVLWTGHQKQRNAGANSKYFPDSGFPHMDDGFIC